MTAKSKQRYLVLALASLVMTASPPLQAEPTRKEQAVKLYKEAMGLYKKGRFKLAIEKFDGSHALYPHLNNVYYMAEAHRRLGDLRKSHEHYTRYAAMLTQAQRADFQVKLKKLRWERECKLSVASQPGGAQVQVDGKAVAQTPPDGSPVNIMIKGGSHQITVSLKDHTPVTSKMDAEFGEPLALSVALKPVARPKPVVAPTPKPARGPTLGDVLAAKEKADAEAPKPEPKPAPAPAPEPDASDSEPTPNHPGDGLFFDLYAGAAFPDYGDDNLDLGAATTFGLHLGYLLRWGRIGLQLGAAFLAAPVTDKTGNAGDDQDPSWFITFLAGPGLRVYITDNLWAGASIYLGASTLHGATADSFFFKDTNIAEVTGSFTSFALRPELTVGWHIWRGLTLVLTAFAADYTLTHGDFTANINHVLRYQVGGGVGWSF